MAEMNGSPPKSNVKDILPWIVVPAILVVLLMPFAFLQLPRATLVPVYQSIPPYKEVYGYDKINVIVGRTVVHPHVSGEYRPVLRPSTIERMKFPFAIDGTFKDGYIRFEKMGDPADDVTRRGVEALISRWNDARLPYVCPMREFEFTLNFFTPHGLRLEVRRIVDTRENTASVFYGPSKYGRYAGKIIPMEGFGNFPVKFLEDAGGEYEELDRAFRKWLGKTGEGL